MYGEQITQGFLRKILSDRLTEKIGSCRESVERAFQVAHVGTHAFGDQKSDVLRYLQASRRSFAQQDRCAGFEIRRIDRDREPPAQARLQPRLKIVHFLRITIAGQDDLLFTFEQGVECVEEFFLRRVFSGEKLNIVNQ